MAETPALLAPACSPVLGNYFVATYPPFSCWSHEALAAWEHRLDEREEAPAELGLYVHIPFCQERCTFCYYLSYDDRSTEIDDYVAALGAELEAYARTPYLAGRLPAFVYFGGGTPSLLNRRRLETLFASLKASFGWQEALEVSFECAPKSVTADKLALLRDHGVTRLSLGVQQLDDRVLAQNGRIHLVADVERAYEAVRRVGFPVVNLDLIVGLVGESDRSFDRSLDRVVALAPESVTLYQLEIPLNTPLARQVEQHTLSAPLASWDVKRARLARAFDRLAQAGYEQATAYARVRDPVAHRFVYQQDQYRGADLLGIGASAFSYLGGVHQQNRAGLGSYLAAMRDGGRPLGRAYASSREEQMVREFVLQLKLGGADAAYFRDKFGVEPRDRFAAPLTDLAGRGYLVSDDSGVRMTSSGLVRVDELLDAFYLSHHRGVRYS